MMATLADLEAALVNADAAGDAEGARVLANEIIRLRRAPGARPGPLERGARGLVKGLSDPRDAMNQLVTRGAAAAGVPGGQYAADWWESDIKRREADYKQDVRGGQDDFDFGRLGGNMLATAPISAALPPPATIGRAVVGGALSGGIFGGMQPVTSGDDFAKEKARQVVTGAASGAAMAPIAYGVSRVISPQSSPEVKLLRSEGVTPTPGQMLGGVFKSAEEKAQSVPLLGAAIKAGQSRSNEQFNAAAINRALAPVNQRLPEGMAGAEAIVFAERVLRSKYDDALSAVGPVRLDQQMSADLGAIYRGLASLPKDKADQFARIAQKEIGDRAQRGVLTPEAMKAAESNIGKQAAAYLRNDDFDVRQLGEALDAARDALREMVGRQAPPQSAEMLKAANAGWANFKRVQRAASYKGAEDGIFNASQLHGAVRATDRSKDHAAFARGSALMQDLSSAGQKVLTSKIPNSGTADRALGAAALMTPFVDSGAASLPILSGMGAASLLYTPQGQRAMAGLLASRPAGAQAVAESVRRLGIPAGMALTPAMQGLLGQ